MPDAICPSCNHPAKEHDKFYCHHVECFCNISGDTAEARYWAVELLRQNIKLLGEIDKLERENARVYGLSNK